jgi:hypothetical protein
VLTLIAAGRAISRRRPAAKTMNFVGAGRLVQMESSKLGQRQYEFLAEIELKSLILAQIERWRHALHMQVERG